MPFWEIWKIKGGGRFGQTLELIKLIVNLKFRKLVWLFHQRPNISLKKTVQVECYCEINVVCCVGRVEIQIGNFDLYEKVGVLPIQIAKSNE